MKNSKAVLLPLSVLALILALCLINTFVIRNKIDDILLSLEKCDNFAVNEQWDEAEIGLIDAQRDWLDISGYLCIVIDQTDVEDISIYFNSSVSYLRSEDYEDLRSELSRLRSAVFLIGETEEPSLENIF